MSISRNKLFEDALHLEDGERAELVSLLIESLDIEIEEGVEAAWLAEIERRMETIDLGEVEMVSWEKVRERLVANLDA